MAGKLPQLDYLGQSCFLVIFTSVVPIHTERNTRRSYNITGNMSKLFVYLAIVIVGCTADYTVVPDWPETFTIGFHEVYITNKSAITIADFSDGIFW